MKAGLMKVVCGLLVVFALFFTGSADASIKPYALTVTPHISGHIFEGNENAKNAAEYGVSFGYNFSKHWAAELTGSYYTMEELSPGIQEFDVVNAKIDALYHFQPDEKIVPYFIVGLGGLSIEQDAASTEHSNEDFSANYGFGFKFFTTDWLAIRTEVKHLFRFDVSEGGTKHNKTYNNLLLSAGFLFQLGGVEEISGKLIDSDDDGIVDNRDRCPDTPPGYGVDGNGCPVDSDSDGVVDAEDLCADTESGTEVDANGCPLVTEEVIVEDADSDGILDINDKCPNTPAEIPVNSYGCPSDSDGDTIFDIDDDCPNTPAGTAVGPDGCGPDEVNIKTRYEDDASMAEAFRSEHPEGTDLAALAKKESIDLDISFAPNRSTIDPQYDADMKQAAAFIAAHPGVKIAVEGHTDSTGSKATNKRLSQKRADTVRWIMVRDYGVDPKRIVATGFGESQPIADNSSQDGRARNRRVLMKVVQ